MKRNEIIFFVEGNDDILFINNIVKKYIEKKNRKVLAKPIRYKNQTAAATNKFLKTYSQKEIDYIFLHDQDSDTFCFESLKNKLKSIFSDINQRNIIIVKKEIESWLISGISKSRDKMSCIGNKDLNRISKRDFQIIKDTHFRQKDIHAYIYSHFDLDTARQNDSFRYFLGRIDHMLK
jgi:peptidyl-tRNA hydrolase